MKRRGSQIYGVRVRRITRHLKRYEQIVEDDTKWAYWFQRAFA